MIQFTPTVGVAPGTTTMQLGGAACVGCPDDPRLTYWQPPKVATGLPPGVRAMPKGGFRVMYDPYATESLLKGGLRGLGAARPGVGVLAAVLGFAGVLGYALWRGR